MTFQKTLISICKTFADDIFIFSKIFDKKSSQRSLNNALSIINKLALQWKMCFNTDPSKQPIEINFARKSDVEVYLLVELENSLNSPVQILKS